MELSRPSGSSPLSHASPTCGRQGQKPSPHRCHPPPPSSPLPRLAAAGAQRGWWWRSAPSPSSHGSTQSVGGPATSTRWSASSPAMGCRSMLGKVVRGRFAGRSRGSPRWRRDVRWQRRWRLTCGDDCFFGVGAGPSTASMAGVAARLAGLRWATFDRSCSWRVTDSTSMAEGAKAQRAPEATGRMKARHWLTMAVCG